VEVELSSLSQKAAEHLLVQLLSQDKRLFTILLVFIGAVITTPLVEEFLYRGVLTGWLVDSANVHLAKLGLSAKKAKFISTEIAIICPALFFAMNHTGYKNDYSVDFLLVTIFVVTLANCITLVAGFFYLTQVRKFTYDQIGFRMDKFIFDVMVAVVVSICLIPPLLILTSVLRFMFPTLVIDPFPLFIFAVMLGAIFLTTRRLLPCVIIHAILNGISFATLMLL
jgi:membrane protease YdiL (CAAX protease family)